MTKWIEKIEDCVGCVAPAGVAYKIYNKLAGKLICVCCVFWRGTIIGAVIGAILGASTYFIK